MTDLKPCPFCGGTEDVALVESGALDWYTCEHCMPSNMMPEIMWNRRPIEDALRTKMETLRRRLAEIDAVAMEPTDTKPDADMACQLIHDMAHIHLVATGEMDRLTRTDTQQEDT